MRLLRLDDDGEFSLFEYVGRNIPRYAILSHTWGMDHEEVTFRDLTEGAGKSKAGYRKLTFCAKQAAHDDLQFFWVDTCCIDKLSSAELSEAINSMFRWYHDAAKCYVYLSDVSIGDFVRNDLSFQKSRWFTRGWTLQELVAPTSVEFFSAEGERLGDKVSLVQEIYAITGISVKALQGSCLSQFSVDERMSWAEKRETKREEDAAYSLLGIFDIHMPLLYGEGQKKAFTRLQKEIRESLRDEWPILSRIPAAKVAETLPRHLATAVTTIDTSKSYILTNAYTGPTKVLAISTTDSSLLIMDTAARDAPTNQQWFLTATNVPTFYRLHTVSGGSDLALDVINDAGTGSTRLHMTSRGNYSGQYWRLDCWSGGSDFRLSNNFTGLDMHLDVYSDTLEPHLASGDYSGQHWRLNAVVPANSSASTSASTTLLDKASSRRYSRPQETCTIM